MIELTYFGVHLAFGTQIGSRLTRPKWLSQIDTDELVWGPHEGHSQNRRIAFVQDFSNSFVYVFFSISLKSIIAFGTFFHCLEIEMHKSAQWIKIFKIKSHSHSVFIKLIFRYLLHWNFRKSKWKYDETFLRYFSPPWITVWIFFQKKKD